MSSVATEEQNQESIEEGPEDVVRQDAEAELSESNVEIQDAETRNAQASLLGPTIKRFSNVIERNTALNAVELERDPLAFYADVRLTPIKVKEGLYHVLSSRPGLQKQTFDWKYSVVYHGKLTYSWSLLRMGRDFRRTSPVLRPLAILETSSKQFQISEMRITDLVSPLEARSFQVCHYHDSWRTEGNHVGFQLNSDYTYEWQTVEYPPGSQCYELYLWRTNLNNPEHAIPAARIVTQDLILNPMESSKLGKEVGMWCVELDVDRVPAHIALTSAFAIKATHSRFHSWFAPKVTTVPPALPLVNFAFQDEGRVLQRSQKYWGDWEDSVARRDGQKEEVDFKKVRLIRVFNKAYLKKYAIPGQILEMLETEADHRIALLRAKLSIHD